MDPSNPYAPPTAPELSSDTSGLRYQNAGQGKRFINYLIDTYVPAVGIGFVIGATSPAALDWMESLNTWENLGLGYVYSLFYYVLMEGTARTTLGKLITGTRVVNEDGGAASFAQILGRTFARFIPFEQFSFLGSRNDRGWHDTLSRTRVIDLRAEPIPTRHTGSPRALPPQQPRPQPFPQRTAAPPAAPPVRPPVPPPPPADGQ